MNELKRKYFIGKEAIDVSKEVFTIYHQMGRQERYQIERDQKNGLLHYDAWDSEDLNMLDIPGLPAIQGGKAQIIPTEATPAQRAIMAEFILRADAIRAGRVKPEEDNIST